MFTVRQLLVTSATSALAWTTNSLRNFKRHINGAGKVDRRCFYESRAKHREVECCRFYHSLLKRLFRFLVPEGMSVLEIGCGLGDLLAAIQPSRGVGVDFSKKMVLLARERHHNFEFYEADALTFKCSETFDYILLSDLVNDIEDVQGLLEHLKTFANPRTRLIVNFYNYLWHPVLILAEKVGLKSPCLVQNWLSRADLKNLLYLAGWQVVTESSHFLWPVNTPVLQNILNRWFAPLLPDFCLTLVVTARLMPREKEHFSCSVVVPARNEEGNIEAAVQRIPEMGLGTEILFIEGHSRDNTWIEIQRVAAKYPNKQIKILKQQSSGKGGAVREAFKEASGELLIILDADLTVAPEELDKFYEAARTGRGEFINGVRLVYPMEDEAMQFCNKVANKFFSLAFTWLLGQPVKDTLCGTKVLFKRDYETIAENRSYFGDFDPFGDFDLLFGAARLNMKIVDLPVRYGARSYGSTNIQRWRHGWLLWKMTLFAARRLKFL